jgi:hypothetical protein
MPLLHPDIELSPQGTIDIDIEHWRFYEEIGLCRFNPRAIGMIRIPGDDDRKEYVPPTLKEKEWLVRWQRR